MIEKPRQLAESVKAPYLLYENLRRFELIWGGKLVVDVRDQ